MTDLFKKLVFSNNWFKYCATIVIVNFQAIFWIGWVQEGNDIIVTENLLLIDKFAEKNNNG